MIGFALCHGWAFEASALSPLQEALERRFPQAACAVFDLGFTGRKQVPALAPERRWIALGHSWGFAWLMRQPVPWHALVSINGFTRFCRRPGHPQGTPVRLLQAMLERLEGDPDATVQDFYRRCGSPQNAPPHLDLLSLRAHLAALRDLDATLPPCPTLALATQDDAVVPVALAQACFAPPRCTLHVWQGDHVRLLREADACVDAVDRFLEEMHA